MGRLAMEEHSGPTGHRLYRLAPWVIRVLIPSTIVGTYVLYASDGTPIYVGRSDTCLRRRLVTHAVLRRAKYFDYQVRWTPERAYIAECAAFHAFAGLLTNAIHPASPSGCSVRCPFCRTTFDLVRSSRVEARSPEDMAMTGHTPGSLEAPEEMEGSGACFVLTGDANVDDCFSRNKSHIRPHNIVDGKRPY